MASTRRPTRHERERFLRTMRFQPVDRPPLWGSIEATLWPQTYQRWRKEGLPYRIYEPITVEEFFGFDRQATFPVNFGFVPPFEEKIIKQTEKYKIWIDEEGIVKKELKDSPANSMPQFLEFPVKCRKDFENLKFRLNPFSKERFPKNLGDLSEIYTQRDIPLRLMGDRFAGFFGPLRSLMGLEKFLVTFYDDPQLIEEMMEAKMNLILSIVKQVLEITDIDSFWFWEDMAYNKGSLLSPRLFKKYMVPRYKVITNYLRDHGVDIIIVDSDGNLEELIPLWLKAGINGFFPLEVQAGMDVVKLRKKYGKDILLVGGVDKRALTKGKREIKEEIQRVTPAIEEGGYIPMLDHTPPPNVSFKNYYYYIKYLKRALTGSSLGD